MKSTTKFEYRDNYWIKAMSTHVDFFLMRKLSNISNRTAIYDNEMDYDFHFEIIYLLQMEKNPMNRIKKYYFILEVRNYLESRGQEK